MLKLIDWYLQCAEKVNDNLEFSIKQKYLLRTRMKGGHVQTI